MGNEIRESVERLTRLVQESVLLQRQSELRMKKIANDISSQHLLLQSLANGSRAQEQLSVQNGRLRNE